MEGCCFSPQLNVMRMTMKMVAISTITVLLLLCPVVTAADSQGDCDKAVTNDNFTVPLQHKLDKTDILRWKHNNVVIFHRKSDRVIKGKADDVNEDGSLKLTKVDKSKAGTYTPEVHDKNGIAATSLKSTNLCIYDRVKMPTVQAGCEASFAKFTCTGSQPKDSVIAWLQNGKVLEKDKGPTLRRKAKEVESDSFSCKVSNAVSSETSAPAKQTCTQQGKVLPDTLFGINIWIIVGLGAGVVALLIIITIGCCIRNKWKQRMQVKDEEELRLGFTSPNQQHHQHHQHHHQHNHPPDRHHHHHHHHQQQQPAGHTGPRQHRTKQPRNQNRPGAPEHPNRHPQPSPRRAAQGPRPVDNVNYEQPPPLPQPRKKAPKTPRV